MDYQRHKTYHIFVGPEHFVQNADKVLVFMVSNEIFLKHWIEIRRNQTPFFIFVSLILEKLFRQALLHKEFFIKRNGRMTYLDWNGEHFLCRGYFSLPYFHPHTENNNTSCNCPITFSSPHIFHPNFLQSIFVNSNSILSAIYTCMVPNFQNRPSQELSANL